MALSLPLREEGATPWGRASAPRAPRRLRESAPWPEPAGAALPLLLQHSTPRRRTRDHLALARKKAVLGAVGFSPENVPKTPGLSRALWGMSRACAVVTLPQRTPQASADGRDTVGAPSAGDSEGTLARVPPQRSAPAGAPLPGGPWRRSRWLLRRNHFVPGTWQAIASCCFLAPGTE